jgi:TetR/AcrR family transcriptional regulator, transcriptional repressor for nem operon
LSRDIDIACKDNGSDRGLQIADVDNSSQSINKTKWSFIGIKMSQRKGERTKQRIVETAAGLMNRQGWLSTPVSTVLASTGLQKGGLYNHFDSMADLSTQAFNFASGQLLLLVRKRLSESGTAEQRLRHLLAAFTWVGQRRPPYHAGCPILNAAIEADDTNEGLRLQVADVARSIISELESVIALGRQTGEFRQSLEPRRAAQLMFASFEGGVMLAGLMRDPNLFSEIKNDLETVIQSWLEPGWIEPKGPNQ